MEVNSNIEPRLSLVGIIRGLMLSDHLGDVFDEINYLHDLVGLPRPEGNFLEGWTEGDFHALGAKETVAISEDAGMRFLRHEDTFDDRTRLKDALVSLDKANHRTEGGSAS